jgi:phage-related protein
MFSDMDSQALFGSEVFRNFVQLQKQSENRDQAIKKQAEAKLLKDLEDLQIKVNSNNVLKEQFKKLQTKFINDSAYRETVNPDFVRGVLLLKIED